MKVELMSPLAKPAQIRVTYNGTELFTRDFPAGETPKLEFETPPVDGEAKAFLILDGKEIPLGSAVYSYGKKSGQPDNDPRDHDGDGLPDRGPVDDDGDGLPDRGSGDDEPGDGLPDHGGDGLPVRDGGQDIMPLMPVLPDSDKGDGKIVLPEPGEGRV